MSESQRIKKAPELLLEEYGRALLTERELLLGLLMLAGLAPNEAASILRRAVTDLQ